MRKKLLAGLFCLLLIAGCSDQTENKKPVELCNLECEEADMSAYGDALKDTHQFLSATYKQTNTFYENEEFTGVIYYGRSTCAWCLEIAPLLDAVAKEYDRSIYYVDKGSKENADQEEEKKAIQILDEAYGLDKNEEGQPTLYVPEVVFVKEGKIVDHHLGTLENHDAHERKMTKDEKRLVSSIYENLMNELD